MTTPTNARQTSERERLAVACEQSGQLHLVEIAKQLRADEAEIAQLRAERDEAFRMSRCECGTNECCANLVKHSAEISQLRMDLARLRLTHTETAANLAAADEQVRVSDGIIAALRAENEALRTVTDQDVVATSFAYLGACSGSAAVEDRAMRAALQSFIRSKESRRG